MRVIGIVAEYNPYTNGHEYLVREARRAVGDERAVVISVMSGAITQRGIPALLPKLSRTRACLVTSKQKKDNSFYGSDLVLELPVCFSCAPASEFASGAVRTLTATGVLTDIAFGIDIDDSSIVKKLAEYDNLIKSSPEYTTLLKSKLSEGSSFPSASAFATINAIKTNSELREVFADTDFESLSEALRKPNSILAFEYLKEIKNYNSKNKAHPVNVHIINRRGEDYSSQNMSEYASAGAIRNKIYADKDKIDSVAHLATELAGHMPDSSLAVMLEDLSFKRYSLPSYKEYCRDITDRISVMSPAELEEYAYMGDELASYLVNKINSKLKDEILDIKLWEKELSTKHFTSGRINRACSSLLIGRKRNMTGPDLKPRYIRVLGFNNDGRYCLKVMSKCAKLPVIHKLSDFKTCSEDIKQMAELDIIAGNMQGKYLHMPLNYEWEEMPIIIK